VSARRYKAILGEDKFRYMAVYEVQDEKTFRALMKSGHMKALRRDYDRWFGKVSGALRLPAGLALVVGHSAGGQDPAGVVAVRGWWPGWSEPPTGATSTKLVLRQASG
jgi:hypothetical protein